MTLYKTKPRKKPHLINLEFFKIEKFSYAIVFLGGLGLGILISQSTSLPDLSPAPQSWSASSMEAAPVRVCFSPEGHCTDGIIQAIQEATSSIYVQAYGFTSLSVAQVLIDAKKRGVDVQVILDKSQITAKKSQLPLLLQNNIPVSIDSVSGIAHNKVMIIDTLYVLTGSFNFTNAADSRNAENVLLIKDSELASIYKENWEKRALLSRSYTGGI